MSNEEESSEEEIYSEEGREALVDDDEIEPWEEGFMEGAESGGKGAKCRKCGKILEEMDDVIEKEIDGEIYRFCSDECVDKFEEKKEKD